ncbi:hypothetical protein FO519_001655 [Halicephalobus sp. NKZ332]|nr:hypothetical protein FO519_001655 [Halicephalobus sp. NKZ332]
MAPVEVRCEEPPPVTSFHLRDIGDSYAILEWSTPSIRPKYSFQLAYNPFDDPFESVTHHFPKSQTLALIKNLRAGTNYTSQVFSQNECSKSAFSELSFETTKTVLHPALIHIMPHEVILTLIVFFIWAVILRRFFIVYNRLTLVSPQSLGGATVKSSYSGPLIFLTHSATPPSSRRQSRSHYLMKPLVHPEKVSLKDSKVSAPEAFLAVDHDNNHLNEPVIIRKVSEVLLGKATNDIRRCSAPMQSQDAEPEEKPNLGRRKSLLESLSGIGGSLRRKGRKMKKYGMEALKEEKESTMTPVEMNTTISVGSRSIGYIGLGGWKSENENLLSETCLDSVPLTNMDDKDTSPESFVTASDVEMI